MPVMVGQQREVRAEAAQNLGSAAAGQSPPSARGILKRKAADLIADEGTYLREYQKIKAEYAEGRVNPPRQKEAWDSELPDPQEIAEDQERLQNIIDLLRFKQQDNERLRRDNEKQNLNIQDIELKIRQYKKRINEYDAQLRSGRRVIEVPCNHAEEINQLEVLLASKKNEHQNLRRE